MGFGIEGHLCWLQRCVNFCDYRLKVFTGNIASKSLTQPNSEGDADNWTDARKKTYLKSPIFISA